jgi:hypothetical protein
MALPSFIDVVVVTVKQRVESAYVNGAKPLLADHDQRYVMSEAVAPDAGDVVLGQSQKGVQRAVKGASDGVKYIGSNTALIVASDPSLFNFQAAANASTQISPESQGQDVYVPAQPAFSTSVIWV